MWLAACLSSILSFQSIIFGDNKHHQIEPIEEMALRRAPLIFNAIHHAGQQWGSSLHHNGMSFFPVTVPEGVLLYHGSRSPSIPLGPDWLAFEIEHAEIFARGQQRYETLRHGYLHIYKATRPLRLLYVDGSSGGTSDMGTMDSQNCILRTQEGYENQERCSETPPPSSWAVPVDETDLAKDLCNLSRSWSLDGILRMEAGFEIIKCDFSRGLEQVQALQRPYGGKFSPDNILGSLEFLRGISERYEGLGSRLRVEYSSMVSALFFNVNLTNPDPARQDLPRLLSVQQPDLMAIKKHLRQAIAYWQNGNSQSLDWQSVSNLIVGRYADRIQLMVDKVDSIRTMAKEINFLLTIFIDYSKNEPNIPEAINRCQLMYLRSIVPASQTDHLIYIAFKDVTRDICETLFEVREMVVINPVSIQSSLAISKEILRQLMERLRWTRFKHCRSCPLDQVCLIPMWPLGTVEQYHKPSCSTGATDKTAVNYWGLKNDKSRPYHNAQQSSIANVPIRVDDAQEVSRVDEL